MRSDQKPEGAERSAPLFTRAAEALVWLAGALSSLLILVAFSFTIIAVFWRYVLDDPLLWPEDVTGWTLVGLIMLGVAEAYRRGDHIAIDLVAGQLSRKARAVQEVWAHLAVLAFSVVLGLSAWESVTFAYDFGAYTSGNVEIAIWIPQSPMILGSFLLGLIAFSRILEVVMNRSARRRSFWSSPV